MSKNSTQDSLKGLPFTKMSDLKAEQHKIRMAAWQRLERARAHQEFLQTREEFSFWNEQFKRGIDCTFGSGAIVKVIIDESGTHILLNEDIARSMGEDSLMEHLVTALTKSAGHLYRSSNFLMPSPGVDAASLLQKQTE